MGSQGRAKTSAFVAAGQGRLTRRGFLGSAASLPIAAQAAQFGGGEGLVPEETDLDISYRAGMLKVAIVRGIRPERRAFWSELRYLRLAEPETDPGGRDEGTVWSIETARFGPDTKVRLRNTRTSDGRMRYVIALHDIAFGRVSDRRMRFILEEHLVPDPMGEALFREIRASPGAVPGPTVERLARQGVPRRRVFSIRVTTSLWSLSRRPQAQQWFELSPPEKTPPDGLVDGVLRLRHWIRTTPQAGSGAGLPETPTGVALLVDAGRITSTLKLIFNGQVGYRDSDAGRNVLLSFDQTGTWRARHPTVKLEALTEGLGLDDLTLRWQRVGDKTEDLAEAGLSETARQRTSDGEKTSAGRDRAGQIAADRAFEVVGFATVSQETRDLRIPAGKDMPGLALTLARSRDGARAPLRVQFRVLAETRIEGNRIAPGQIRSEASLLADWDRLDITGPPQAAAGPFLALRARLMERVDAPARMDDFDYARCVGNIGFGGDFTGSASRHWRLTSPVGPLGFRGLTPEDERDGGADATPLAEDPFRQRHGDQVQAVFSWGRSARRGFAGRARPRADWIEVNGVLREAAVHLEGADFNRLTFAPTFLTFLFAPDELAPPQTSYVRLAAPKHVQELAQIDLSDAALVASRSADLLALTFGFSDMALSLQRGGRTELVRRNAACRITTDRTADGAHEVRDDRPVLVVEFPGQHLFEEAFFVPKPLDLPDVRLEPEPGRHARMTVGADGGSAALMAVDRPARLKRLPDGAGWALDPNDRQQVVDLIGRLETADQITTFRQSLQCVKRAAQTASGHKAFETMVRAYAAKVGSLARLPRDQEVYIGPFALDPDALRLASRLWQETFAAELKDHAETLLADVAREAERLFREARAQKPAERAPEARRIAEADTTFEGALALEQRLEVQFPSYQLFRTVYRDVQIRKALGGAGPDLGNLAVERFETVHVDRIGGTPAWVTHAGLTVAELGTLRKEAVPAFVIALRGENAIRTPARARLANPSRLAFRVRCRDGITAARNRVPTLDTPDDAMAEETRGRLAFSLAALTRFSDFDLSVVRRAQAIYRPSETGRIDALSRRRLDLSAGARLDHLGFTSGRFVTAETRLGEIAASLKAPGKHETAIEIPARLILSPDQNAVVIAPQGRVPDCVYFRGDGAACPSGEGRDTAQPPLRRRDAQLWTARFLVNEVDPHLRAVHSPDLRPDVFAARARQAVFATEPVKNKRFPGGSAPPRGPFAPWHLGAHQSQTTSLGVKDASEPLPSDPAILRLFQYLSGEKARLNATDPKDLRFRSALDAYARHELVLLSSAWGLPVLGRRTQTGHVMAGASQSEVEPRYRLIDVAHGSALYEPRTLGAIELALTPLGGTLRHASSFEPYAAAFDSFGRPLFDATSVESWQHWANLGRDVHCEIVYKGFLWPIGQRASLVQVTEREFFIDETGAIRAILRQRLFIRVGKAEKLFPALKQPANGRRFPVERLKNLTTQTPDIVDPSDTPAPDAPDAPGQVLPNGRVALGQGTKGLIFWPRTARLPAANVRFELDLVGTLSALPLIFVDNVAASDAGTLKALAGYYNALPTPDPLAPELPQEEFDPYTHVRTLDMGGVKRRYAAEQEAGSASCETRFWTLCATGLTQASGRKEGFGPADRWLRQDGDFQSDPLLQGADQPPFYPALESCRIRVRQAERLAGGPLTPDRTPKTADPRYLRAVPDGHFVEYGLPAVRVSDGETEIAAKGNVAEAYLALIDQFQLDMGSKGNQSGGVYRPSGRVVGLSRSRGVLTWADRLWHGKRDTRLTCDEVFSVAGVFSAGLEAESAGGTSGSTAVTDALAGLCSQTEATRIDPKVAKTLERIRKLYSDIVDGNAKILGLVSLRDLFKFIDALDPPSTGMPQLAEHMQYGANDLRAAIGAGQDAVEGVADALDETADLVRETVIQPLAEAVREIRKGWDELDRDIAKFSDRLPGNVLGDMSFARIFPDLHCTLLALDTALARAMAAADALAFTLAVSEVHSAGRRFLDAVFRAAADPGRRLEAGLQQGITGIFELGRKLEQDRFKLIRAAARRFLKDARTFDVILSVAAFFADKKAAPPAEIERLAEILATLLVPADAEDIRLPVLILPPIPAVELTPEHWAQLWEQLLPRAADLHAPVKAMLVRFLQARGEVSLDDLLQTSRSRGFFAGRERIDEGLLRIAMERRAALVAEIKKNANLGAQAKAVAETALTAYQQQLERFARDLAKQQVRDWLNAGWRDEWALIKQTETHVRAIVAAIGADKFDRALEELLALARLHFGPLTGFAALCKEVFAPFVTLAQAISPGEDGLHAQLIGQIEAGQAQAEGYATALTDGRKKIDETLDAVRDFKVPAAARDQHEAALEALDKVQTAARAVAEFNTAVETALRDTRSDLVDDRDATAALAARFKGLSAAACGSEALTAFKGLHRDLRRLADIRRGSLGRMADRVADLVRQAEMLLRSRDFQQTLALGAAIAALQALFAKAKPTASLEKQLQDLETLKADLMARAEAYAQQIATKLSTLLVEMIGLLRRLRDALEVDLAGNAQIAALFGKDLDALIETLKLHIGWLEEVKGKIDAVIAAKTALTDLTKLTFTPPQAAPMPVLDFFKPGAGARLRIVTAFETALQPHLDKLADMGAGIFREMREDLVVRVNDGIVSILDADLGALLPDVLNGSGGARKTLVDLYAEVRAFRDAAHDTLALAGAGQVVLLPPAGRPELILQNVAVFVPKHSLPLEPGSDRLAGDLAWLQALVRRDRRLVADKSDPAWTFLSAFVSEWRTLRPTPIEIAEKAADIAGDILKGDLFAAIDFNALRAQVEDYVLSLVPTRIDMSYAFGVELGARVREATLGIFAPGPGSRLTIDSGISIDLGFSQSTVSARTVGSLGPFDVKLVGDAFDALTLKFNGAVFTAETGRKMQFDISYSDYEIGPMLEFVQQFQSFLAPKGNSGFYLDVTPAPLGVEAGYILNLGDFSIGAMAISNVGLATSAVLPFENSDARFKASLSTRLSPFTITYTPYGGSGFFSIEANANGILGFEASFEFGGSTVFAFGPLSGKGRLMAGFYIRQSVGDNGQKLTELSATFYVGGSAQIWIFSFAASLSVRLGMINGDMSGEAVFSFSFSMGLADFDYTVVLFKREAKGFAGGQQASLEQRSLGEAGTRLADLGFGRSGLKPLTRAEPRIDTDTACQVRSWKSYAQYFTDHTAEDLFQ